MSEPNDTAQEGFDQLKRNLEVRYPEDSDLSLDEFLNVESLLALAVRVCGPGADPRKADRLLSNYQLIRPETIGADGHLMQMARRHLFSLASSTAWRRLLGLYERAEYERYRFFDIADGGMALREHPLTGIDRMPIYIDRLLGDVKLSHKNVVARPKGRYSYTCKPEATGDTTVTGSIRWVTMPDAVPPQTGKIDDIPRKSRRPPIDITLDELISTADEVGEKTGKTHYAAVLRRVKDQGLLKRARGGSTSVADGLRLDEVVSLVGLVGAGKSVLANMLIVCLAKRGLRAVSLLNSVSDVMESVVLLREAGISASPLVSRGRRIERLDEFFDHDDSMLLDHSASKYLETACIMDGLSSSDPEACGYGSTPCRGLRSKKGGANSCPYWDVCPSQAMARESLTSDVVVTTPTGFATMIVGRERKAFFEEALQQFDVVLFDEADRVQAQLDGCFAPSMSFQELIRNAAEMRSGNLGIVLSQTMATLKDELDADGAGKALVIVNSYREAEDARDRIEQEFRRKGQAIKVAALVRNNHDHREHFVPRSEVYKFCDHPAKVLVAPAMAIERGFNIVDRGGHAVFTSLIFSVRPMGTPHDLGGRYRKLNGLIEREVGDYPANPGEFATEVRASAWRTWKTMERDENLPMGAWRTMGRQFLVDDAISTLMVTIIQIFGRLARLADKERPAPHVYFADAAFRGGDGKLSFRTLEELGAYMERLMHDSDQPEVAKALYGPFYESFRKGIGNVGL